MSPTFLDLFVFDSTRFYPDKTAGNLPSGPDSTKTQLDWRQSELIQLHALVPRSSSLLLGADVISRLVVYIRSE